MLCYSDFILANQPFSYCRLNEPENHNIYYDLTGNGNHCFRRHLTETEVKSANNQYTCSYTGEPGIRGIVPLATSSGLQIDWPVNSPSIQIPQFYSEVISAVHGKSKSNINQISGEILFNCSGIDKVGTIGIGPFRIVASNNNLTVSMYYHKNYYPEGNSNYELEWITIYDAPITNSFLNWNRIHAHVNQTSPKNFIVSVMLNGLIVVESAITLLQNDMLDINYQPLYNAMFLTGTCVYSSFSIYFNRPFPSQDWFSNSQTALTQNYVATDYQKLNIICSECLFSFPIENNIGSSIPFLDKNLLIGNNHFNVESVESLSSTTTKVSLIPPREIPFLSHGFNVGDIVSIGGSNDQNLNGNWKVLEIYQKYIIIETLNSVISSTFSDQAIIKKAPIGGGYWDKTYFSNGAYYSSKSSHHNFKLKISDTEKQYCSLSIVKSDNSGESNQLILKKNLKSTTNKNHIQWKMMGDSKRFYLLIAYRLESPSQSQFILYGDITDFETSEDNTYLMSFKNNHVGNIGFNLISSYPNLKLLPSGHLVCRSSFTQEADARYIIAGTPHLNLIGYGDCGNHIYPSLFPKTFFT